MADYVKCSNCHKRIKEGIPFCPHCGYENAPTGISNEFDEDPYVILQVSPYAEPEVINAAYKQLAKKYHPDNYPSFGSEERMKQINWAFGILGSMKKRQEYDQIHYPEKAREALKREEEQLRREEEQRKRRVEAERKKEEVERQKKAEEERQRREEEIRKKARVERQRKVKKEEKKEEARRQRKSEDKTKNIYRYIESRKTSATRIKDKSVNNLLYILAAIAGIFFVFYVLILVISIPPIVASYINQTSKQATKTPLVQKTITKQSDYPTIVENNKDYGEIPALWEYANEIVEGESITEFHVSGLDSDIVKIEWGWCAKNIDLLEENWTASTFALIPYRPSPFCLHQPCDWAYWRLQAVKLKRCW